MRVVSSLGTVMNRLGLSAAELSRETGINREKIAQISRGTFKTISRRDFQVLMTWARSHGADLFTFDTHPMWRTFLDSPATIFVGENAEDMWVAQSLARFLGTLHSRAIRFEIGTTSIAPIQERISTENCVFIGARRNPASEIAFCLIHGADPFVETRQNQARLPASFVGIDWVPSGGKSAWAANVDDPSRCGISIAAAQSRPSLLRVVPDSSGYLSYAGHGIDAGLLLVCRRPNGTHHDVTTVVVAGYTSLSTREVAADAEAEMIDVDDAELASPNPVLRILRVPFQKRAGQHRRIVVDSGRDWYHPAVASARWARRRIDDE